MTIRWNKKTGARTVCYPYTKNELLDINLNINAAPITIYSDRFNPALKTPPAWLDKSAYPDPANQTKLVKRYYITYVQNLAQKLHNLEGKLAKYDTIKEAEDAINELKLKHPDATNWEAKLHLFPR